MNDQHACATGRETECPPPDDAEIIRRLESSCRAADNVLDAVREALDTPDDASIVFHANEAMRRLAEAEAERDSLREQLADSGRYRSPALSAVMAESDPPSRLSKQARAVEEAAIVRGRALGRESAGMVEWMSEHVEEGAK